jgi:hypothetical protein
LKIKKAIEILSKYPSDSKLVLMGYDGCFYSVSEISEYTISKEGEERLDDKQVRKNIIRILIK